MTRTGELPNLDFMDLMLLPTHLDWRQPRLTTN